MLPDINRAATYSPSRSVVLGSGMVRVEHVPIGKHEFAKEHTVVSNCCNVNGVGGRIPWVEII